MMYEYLKNKRLFLIIFGLSLLLIYFLHFYVYNLPHSDDFVVSTYEGNPLVVAYNIYLEWQGRIFSNILYVLFVRNMDFTVYKIITFLSTISFFSLVGVVIFKYVHKPIMVKITIWLLVISSWLFGLQSPNDAIFWMGG